jgi:hypothetical protein
MATEICSGRPVCAREAAAQRIEIAKRSCGASLSRKIHGRTLAVRAARHTLNIVDTTGGGGRVECCKELPGVFDSAGVVDLVRCCAEDGTRVVRASLVRIERSGVALYRVFMSENRYPTPNHNQSLRD